jgi:hypothetical protein
MLKVADQLAQIRSAIRSELDRVAQSKSNEAKLAETRLVDISNQSREVQGRINDANAADIRLRSLEADVAAKRAVLNSFMERYDQNAGIPLTPPDSRVVSWADVPVDASSPRYGLALMVGMFGFAFVAFGVSLVVERLRSGFNGIQELSEELGLVVAGMTSLLPGRTSTRHRRLAAGDAPALRELALTVRALAHTPTAASPTRIVLITSAVSAEGKSTVALSLARSVANGGQSCLLIDADIRNPSLHTTLGVRSRAVSTARRSSSYRRADRPPTPSAHSPANPSLRRSPSSNAVTTSSLSTPRRCCWRPRALS